MGLFGKKNKDNEDIEAASPEQDLDALVMSAIEQADEEEEQRKADRKQAEIDRRGLRTFPTREGDSFS